MVEIALCIAVVGFALVAIMGVLPTALNVQRDNREETIINHDAPYWVHALKSGAQGMDDLTNYVEEIVVKQGDAVLFQFAFGPPAANHFSNGREIIGLLTQFGSSGADFSVEADVYSITGPALDKLSEGRELGFKYRMRVVIEDFRAPNPDFDFTEQALLQENLSEIRLTFEWSVRGSGGGTVGAGRQVVRSLIQAERPLQDKSNPNLAFFVH